MRGDGELQERGEIHREGVNGGGVEEKEHLNKEG